MNIEEQIINKQTAVEKLRMRANESALLCIMSPTAENELSFKALRREIELAEAEIAAQEALLQARMGFGREVY